MHIILLNSEVIYIHIEPCQTEEEVVVGARTCLRRLPSLLGTPACLGTTGGLRLKPPYWVLSPGPLDNCLIYWRKKERVKQPYVLSKALSFCRGALWTLRSISEGTPEALIFFFKNCKRSKITQEKMNMTYNASQS